MNPIAWFGVSLAVLAALAVALSALGSARWDRASRALTARIDTARRTPAVSRYRAGELDGLPAPVQRYFRAALREGQPIVSAVTIEHTGSMNMSTTGEQWKPFTSWQRVQTDARGFIWNARIALVPGLNVRVHDAYVGGEGLLHAAVLGLFPVADLHGGGELARGELMRFFAEAAWYPTAFLPSQGVRWTPVDDRAARATVSDGPIELTLLFGFDEAGQMSSLRAEARGRMNGRDIVMAPWEGRWSNHAQRNGMTVPLTGEVAWILPEGRKTYWRGTITALAYDMAP